MDTQNLQKDLAKLIDKIDKVLFEISVLQIRRSKDSDLVQLNFFNLLEKTHKNNV